MRAVFSIAMLMSLSACDDAGQADGAAPVPAREITAEVVAAERACADLTGYAPAGQSDKTPEAAALLQKEFNACVAAVAGGGKPELRGRHDAAASGDGQASP